jgi:hypothetical protein
LFRTANAPARGNATPVGVLKALDRLEREIEDLRLELAYSLLERVPRADVHAPARDHEVVDHVAVDRGELPVRERIGATSQAGRPSMMLPRTFRPVVIDAEFYA